MILGQPFAIEKVKLDDLENGILATSWKLEMSHPSVNENDIEKMLTTVLIGTLVSSVKGAWDVSDTMNKLLPDFEFTRIEDFLARVWAGKP